MKKLFSSILISFILFTNLVVPVSVFAAVPTITFQFIADKVLASSDLRAWEVNINTTGIPDGNDVSITLFENGKDVTDKYTAVKINKNTGLYYSGYILKPATNYKITATTPGVSNSFERVTLGTAIPVNIPQEKTNPTDTYWFKDMDGAFRGVNGPLKLPGFATSKECEDAKKVYWTGFNSTDSTIPCSLITQEQVLANFEAEKIKNAKIPGDPAIPVTPKINVAENKSIYKMLVPLPGITCMDSSGQDPNCIPNDIGKYLNFIFKFAIGLCAALAVIMLIIAGVSYMGDESVFGKTEAKKKMFSAILGLIIALGAWALLNTINPDLTGKNGLVIDSANVEIVPLNDRGYNDPKQANGESTNCTPVTNPSSPCTPDKLEKIFPGKGIQMSKICNMESSGRENLASGTDYCMPPGKTLPFSFGLFQVNLSANGKLAGSECVGLFDKAVTGADAISPKYTSGYTCNLVSGKEALYNTCKGKLLDTATNLAIAQSLFNNSKGMGNWNGDKKFCASAFQ